MSSESDAYSAFLVLYLILGIGSIVFFFIGVCAILCCCREQFRGITRKGYVVRDAEQQAPLMVPSISSHQVPVGLPEINPQQLVNYPPAPGFNYAHDAPPPYGTSPPAKY